MCMTYFKFSQDFSKWDNLNFSDFTQKCIFSLHYKWNLMKIVLGIGKPMIQHILNAFCFEMLGLSFRGRSMMVGVGVSENLKIILNSEIFPHGDFILSQALSYILSKDQTMIELCIRMCMTYLKF